MKRILALACFLLIIIGCQCAQAKQVWESITVQKNDSLTLENCIDIAIHNNGDIRRAYMNLQTAINNIGIAKSAYIPTISLGAGISGAEDTRPGGGTSRTLPSASATLQQLIWDFGKTSAYIRMYKFNKIIAQLQYEDSMHDTMFAVQSAYYNVLATKAYVDVEKANVQINLRDYNRTKAFFEEGIRSKVDIVNSEYNLAQARIALIEAETNYQTAWVSLNDSMSVLNPPEYTIENTETFNLSDNYYPTSFLTADNTGKTATDANIDVAFKSAVEKTDVIGSYKYEKCPYTFEEAINYAYEHRHDLRAMEASKKAMEEELKYIKRQYYPTLSGQLGYSFSNTKNYSNNNYSIGVNLNTSFNIKQIKHEIDNAKIQVDYVESQIGTLRLDIFCQVQDAYITAIQLEKQIPLMEVKVRQALENLELSEGRYEVGISDFIELQNAKVNYNNACNEYVTLVYNYNLARADLERKMCMHHYNCESTKEKEAKNLNKGKK